MYARFFKIVATLYVFIGFADLFGEIERSRAIDSRSDSGNRSNLVFEPNVRPQVNLTNQDGLKIPSEIISYDAKSNQLTIERTDLNRRFTFSIELLSNESQATVMDWAIMDAIYNSLKVRAQLKNYKDADGRATKDKYYEIELSNFSNMPIKNFSINYSIHKESNASGGSYTFSRNEAGSGNGSISFDLIGPRENHVFDTNHIFINYQKTKTIVYTITEYNDGSRNKRRSGSKINSARDSLKGITMNLVYKGQIVRKWSNNPTLLD